MIIRDILAICDRIAPFDLAEDYDNVGLLAGSAEARVDTILLALDLTDGVLREAEREGAQLIITHHPILFHARKNLREDDPEGALLCRLVRTGCALIAMHTNYDNAPDGVSDALAAALGLRDVCPAGEDRCLRLGKLPRQMAGAEFARYAGERLGAVVRSYMTGEKPVRRVAVCGGAGGEFAVQAKQAGADAYLTGEVKHHEMLLAMEAGIPVFEAGHYETEQIAISSLANRLQKEINAVQYKVRIVESAACPFAPREDMRRTNG